MTLDDYERSMSPAIRTYEEYEQVARSAGGFVRHVKVLGNTRDRRIPPGTVEVRVRGRWRRRLTREQVEQVRRAIVARQVVGVTLKVRS